MQFPMKCRICGCNSDEECVDDEIDFDTAHGQKNWICWNCWYDITYGSYTVKETVNKDSNKGK